MTPLPILDLIAGMIFIYFLLALANNSLIEIWSSILSVRSDMLKAWVIMTLTKAKDGLNWKKVLKTQLDANGLASQILNHPLLNGVSKQNVATHYMDGKSFAKALVEVLSRHAATTASSDPGKMLDNIGTRLQGADVPDELK